MSLILSFIVTFLLSLIVLLPSFHLGLFGDDWLAFFRYAQHLGPRSPGHWNYLTYYLTPYGPQDILMGLLQKIYDYQSTYYYLASYVLRLIAAFSFYPLVFYLTKNKLSGFFAVLFFSVTVTGLDTTNWVFNMPSYATIALFNTCLYFFVKQREKADIINLLLSAVFYYLAYITTPIRMHGSLLFIFSIEAFWVIQKRSIKIAKKSLIRFAVMLAVFLIVRYTGTSQGPLVEASERFNLGLKAMSEMLSQGRFDFIFYPVIIFGSSIVPDILLPSFQIISKSKLLWSALVPAFLGFIITSALIVQNLTGSGSKLFKKITLAGFCWLIIVIVTFQYNLTTLNDSRFILLLLIGGFGVILAAIFLFKFLKQKNISTAIFLGLSWAFFSFFFAWWWVPASIFPTTYRYLIVTAMGISVFLASLISLGKDKKHQLLLFIFFCFVLLVHIIANRIFINYSLASHNQESSNKIWSSFPKIAEIGKTKEPIIFYFEGETTNGGILHDVITFGFPPHMALLYNIREEDGGIPVPMSDLKDVYSAATDGKSLVAYGYPVKPVPPERIYGFHLQGQDNLINITEALRGKIKQLNSR